MPKQEVLTRERIDALLVKNTFKASMGLDLPYRLFSPYGTNVSAKPLVVFLHGRGDRGIDNSSKIYHEFGFVTHSVSLLSRSMQKIYSCYVLVPQCSSKTENEEWAKWVGNSEETPFKGLTKEGTYVLNKASSASGGATLELIEHLVRIKNIDANRIYLIGLSMGGFGTWEFTARKPNLFAAAVPMAGYSDPSQIENIKHIPYWIFHGEKDKWNPVAGSRNMYSLLKDQKADVRYTEYKNTGHGDAFKKAFKDPELLPWLFSKVKINK